MSESKSMKKNQKCKIGLLAFSLSFFVPFFVNAIDQGAGKVTANVTQPSKRTIKGVVSDVSGEPLIGVSVLVKGTSIGASTNIDGVYSVEVPNNNAVLEFSYVGYQKATLSLANASSYDVVMNEETRVLQEVVVTAMGLSRESKTLTYATQTIKNEEVTRIKDNNFINSLQGKSAGLTIVPNNSGAGGGASKIVLRGSTSILGTNQPLIVVDGVPMQDGMGTQATDGMILGGGRSGDDLLSTINPEDIDNMTILKGPNAAALYGSAANNGVIVITTKSGASGSVKVNVSSTTSIETIAMYPRTQQIYGISGGDQWSAWGPKIGTRSADEVASAPYLMNSARNAVKDFFNKGVTTTNGVTLSGGTENFRTYFSYNNTYQTGLIPNNKFTRNNVMFKESFSLFDKRININTSLNWIHQKTDNAPVVGKALSALYALYRTPADIDMRYFKHNYKHLGTVADNIVSDPEKGNPKLIGQPVQTGNLQILAVLFSKLNSVVTISGLLIADAGSVCLDLGGHGSCLGSAIVDGDVANDDVAALVLILHQSGLHGIVCHLSSLLTGQIVGQRNFFHAVVQIRVAQGQLGRVDGPAVAHQVLDLGVIAQSHQQHLGKLGAQHGSSGVEAAVAVTSQNAFVGAVSNRACAPAVGCHVGIRCHSSRQFVGLLLAHQHVGDDLRSLLTGQGCVGVEVIAVAAIENAGGSHNIDRLFVSDFGVILVVTRVRGESGGHQAQCHGQRQHQGQNLFQILHGSVVLLF